jgi:HEAT repeat protein
MMATHPDVKKRQLALESLRQIPIPEVDQGFVAALRDPSPQIRALAIPEIVRRAGDGATRALCKIAAGDVDARVRAAACAGLSRLDGEEAEAALVGALADHESLTRQAANSALEKATGRILRPSGVAALDEAGRKELQAEWRQVLADRRGETQSKPKDSKPR